MENRDIRESEIKGRHLSAGLIRKGRQDFNYFIYLCNCVLSLDDRQDRLLLDGGRILETEGVDSTQDFLFKSHVVKFINFLFPVRFETFFSFLS